MTQTTNHDDAGLQAMAAIGRERVAEAIAALEPIIVRCIASRVRHYVPDCRSVLVEPTDQGGPGWTLQAVVLPNGVRVAAESQVASDVCLDPALMALLIEFGRFKDSETEPYPYELAFDEQARPRVASPLGWLEFWRLVYSRAIEAGERPDDDGSGLSGADLCMELCLRFQPDPGATEAGRALWRELTTDRQDTESGAGPMQ
jgi:hypothetical protein